MAIIATLKPDRASLERIRAQLAPRQFEQACYQTILRTTRTMTARLQEKARDKLNITPTAIREAITSRVVGVKRDSGDLPTGIISVQRKPLSMIDFRPNAKKKAGVTVTLSKEKGPVTFRHAFKATMASGHVGIFVRARLGLPTEESLAEAKLSSGATQSEVQKMLAIAGPMFIQKRLAPSGRTRGAWLAKVTPQGFAERLPIWELSGPPVITTIEDVTDQQEFEGEVRVEMRKNLMSQLDRFTKK